MAVEQGGTDLRFPVLVVDQAVALPDQQLGSVCSQGGSLLFYGQQFQPVLDGKNCQQVFRRYRIGLRMAEEILQQRFQ